MLVALGAAFATALVLASGVFSTGAAAAGDKYRVPVFVQGEGVVLQARPATLLAKRGVNPPSFSGRDGLRIRWSHWGGPTSRGSGTYYWNTPDHSDLRTFAARVRLVDPRPCGGFAVYQRVKVKFKRKSPPHMGHSIGFATSEYQCRGGLRLAAAPIAVPAAPGGNPSAGKVSLRGGCGTTGKKGTKLRVTSKGEVSCKRAKNVAHSFFFRRDKWDKHGGQSNAQTVWRKGAWGCGLGAGGGGCVRRRDGSRLYYYVVSGRFPSARLLPLAGSSSVKPDAVARQATMTRSTAKRCRNVRGYYKVKVRRMSCDRAAKVLWRARQGNQHPMGFACSADGFGPGGGFPLKMVCQRGHRRAGGWVEDGPA